MNKLSWLGGLMFAALAATPAKAVPEMARFGYFSCNSCHVSPSGGGILTPYGRSISSERLSTWSRKGEELPLEGLVKKQPEWLLLGGDVRYLQLDMEDAKTQTGSWYRMQSDLAVGIALPHVTLVGQGGPRGEVPGNKDISAKPSWREYFAKVDVTDSTFVRVGRFYPKFGLNVPEHSINIRRGLGFDEGQENQNAELTWGSEFHEVTLTRLMGVPHESQADGSREQGYAFNWAYSLRGKHRVSLSLLQGELQGTQRTVAGVNGVFTLSDKWFWMSEEDHQTLRPAGSPPKDQLYMFNRIGYEPVQGVVPILDVESTLPDVRQKDMRRDTYAVGAQWYPRPHFDFEALVGANLSYTDYTFTTTSYLMAHYYL